MKKQKTETDLVSVVTNQRIYSSSKDTTFEKGVTLDVSPEEAEVLLKLGVVELSKNEHITEEPLEVEQGE